MQIEQLQGFLQDNFDLHGDLAVIYSELDAVYKLTNTQGAFTIKCSMPGKDISLIDMEHSACRHLINGQIKARTDSESSLHAQNRFQISSPVLSIHQNEFEILENQIIRVFPWIDLPLQSSVKPLTDISYQSIGVLAANLTKSLADFDHVAAHRFIKWDPSGANWIRKQLYLLDPDWQSTFIFWLDDMSRLHSKYKSSLRKQICYADLNDYNILIQWHDDELVYKAAAIIDFGDMVYTHTINEVAIACVYSCLKTPDPLAVAGQIIASYHQLHPLNEAELELLYYHIAARMMISLTVSAINKNEHPENEYLQITDQDAWYLAQQWKSIHPAYAHYYFRSVCNLEPCTKNEKFMDWVSKKKFYPVTHCGTRIKVLDLSIGSSELGNVPDYENIENWMSRLSEIKKENKADVMIGRYLECRPVYTSESFKYEDNHGPAWRTVHIGLDIFNDENTEVFSPLSGEVIGIANNTGDKDYGPTIILKHVEDEIEFFTLYGHLSPDSLSMHDAGDKIKAGDVIGYFGGHHQNGGWPPHLHFQIILDLFNNTTDYPGVCHFNLQKLYNSICPDPNLILGLKIDPGTITYENDLLIRRKKSVGKNLSVSYKMPLIIPRAHRQYLYDHTGRRYLDTVNNVAHCGHQHPAIIRAAEKQMKLLNTNTRYLYPQLVDFAENLKSFLHPSLSTVYFVNSGSEANELAIRMAKTYADRKDMLVFEHGYHGNTSGLVDLSSYKFDRKGGKGAPPTTHKLSMPDIFRGIYQSDENQYFIESKEIIQQLINGQKKPAAFLAEYILSCGGQVVCPPHYFKKLIEYIKSEDIVYIADEVQTGIGRTGMFCSYEYAGVVPDIVTFGKPLGNGHPLGAVVCNQKIADAFNNGMEYFNTFGGNPVSCVIGNTVLDIVAGENYMDHALKIEQAFYKGFESLKQDFDLVADYRGHGLFLGIEFTYDTIAKKPATNQAKYLVHRMKEYGILMSTDGPDDNVVKIKPPMVFDVMNVEEVLYRMNKILREDYMGVASSAR